MSERSEFLYKTILVLSDSLSIICSYVFSLFIRTHIDKRPFFFETGLADFFTTSIFLIPIWLIILAALGLYKKEIIFSKNRSKEFAKLLFASILGTMTVISISYFKSENIFPIRLIAIYSTILCFVFLIITRNLLRLTKNIFLKKGNHGVTFALIVGSHFNTTAIAEYMTESPESGYRVAGIVSSSKFIPKKLKKCQYSSVKEAIKKCHPDVIFQTDGKNTEYVYRQALNIHVPYYFIPSEDALSSQDGELELFGGTPAILVKTTPLSGGGQVAKRIFDIILSFVALIITFIPLCVIWLIIKVSDPKHNAIYSDIRLTKNNRKFKIYKFRSMKSEYSGITPEEAFEKMGKPELIKKYRQNGDFLENDPRITKIGAFLRKTSLDELPQLWNILKGDISLVGPRALVPGELRTYGNRSMLLSIKSGLTGLAQVSGRRDISFEERRQLDLYYIRNWSLWMDIQILLKTVVAVFKHEGAK